MFMRFQLGFRGSGGYAAGWRAVVSAALDSMQVNEHILVAWALLMFCVSPVATLDITHVEVSYDEEELRIYTSIPGETYGPYMRALVPPR